MSKKLYIDFETRSEAELKEVGLYNYVTHPSTRILMLGWAINKGEPQLWEPHKDVMPVELIDALNDPKTWIIAFNSQFERAVLAHSLGLELDVARFQDPQASARYLSLPANLEDVGQVLGLGPELAKDERGKELIRLFCMPHTRRKKDGGGIYFNDWNTHPAEWAAFGEYCKRDVLAEREVAFREHLLQVFPLPERERNIWLFDQKVNDRGIPVDMQFVNNALYMAEKNKQELLDEANVMTGLENANSQAQLLPWVRERGYPKTNLRKSNIEIVLKDEKNELTEEARKVLIHRLEASSTSYKKFVAMTKNISEDEILRNQFIYMGSARCGRWTGNAVQLHNMARPDKVFESKTNVINARDFIYQLKYEQLKTAFKKLKPRKGENPYYSPLIIMKNISRTVFVAPKGKRFNVCDLNAIETRVGAWVAQCEALLKVFLEGRDPYLDFASKMYSIPYEKLEADFKGLNGKEAQIEAKTMRQIAKPGVLGAVYRLSGGAVGYDQNGDEIKLGLWGYAEAMGVEMSLKQALEVVKMFRESYPEIVQVWFDLEEAVADVLKGKQTVRYIGPDNAIKIDKLTIEGRNPILRIQLPSGRYLHYVDAEIMDVQKPWKVKEVDEDTGVETEVWAHGPSFTYYGKNQKTDQWDLIVSHGGKIFENIVQGIARDVLADKLLEFEAAGLPVVGHVHDEGICLTDDDPFAPGVQEMKKIMDTPVSWAQSLPLGSDGFEDYFYHK